ncbi:MAG: hypothetical protein ACI81L_002115 [Verrucomicrobiales bacterium]|jgi:hypothetical protein
MEFKKKIGIQASTDRVWQVVAHEFDSVGTWSSAIASSAANHDVAVPEGATVGGRVCATSGFGEIEETFTKYSESNKQFTFAITGMPLFISLAQKTIRVRPTGAQFAEVSMHIQMETTAVGKVIGPVFTIKLKATLNTFLEELKNFVENEEISSKKRKQLSRAAA